MFTHLMFLRIKLLQKIVLEVNKYMTKRNVDELVKSICAEFKVIVVVDEDFP